MHDSQLEELRSQIRDKVSADLGQAVAKIEKLAQMVDAVKLFCAVVANVSFAPEGTVTEASHGHVPALIETMAYYLYPFFGTCEASDPTPTQVTACIRDLNELVLKRLFAEIPPKKDEGAQDDIGAIASVVRRHAEIVRGTAFPEQTARKIKEIQGQFNGWFSNVSHITPNRAQSILWAIIRRQEDALNIRLAEIREGLRTAADLWSQTNESTAYKHHLVDDDLLEPDKVAEPTCEHAIMTSVMTAASGSIPVGIEDISELEPPVTSQEWDGLINLIGLTTQTRNCMSEPVDVRQRPLFVLPDKRLILADITNALDALWDAFDAKAKADPAFYGTKYQPHKSKWLENSAVECLSRIFPPEAVYQDLRYPDPDKNDGSETQLDAAVVWGPFLILLEAKAKQFRLESQLGDVGRLRSDLKANIEDAFGQARRAAKYINSTLIPEFKESATGRSLTVQKNQVIRTYLITVSLHHLAGLATRLSQLQDLGLFQDDEFPFSISIADLETILQFCDSPDVFLHYVEKRLKTQDDDINLLADELDMFGAYLQTRLQPSRLWEKDDAKPTAVLLSSYSQQFDDWASFQRGDRSSPPIISLEIPGEISDILNELRKRDDYGARGIAFAILDLPDKTLDAIAKGFRDLQTIQFAPDTFRTMIFTEGDTVVSIVATRETLHDPLPIRTHMRAMFEKYRYKAHKSIAFGVMTTDSSKPFDCAFWLDEPWQHDAEMENLVKNEQIFSPPAGIKRPGRNDKCMCGSGKKYKKCCLTRFDIGRNGLSQTRFRETY